MSHNYTWEQAVEWLRQRPDQQEVVRACYYDDPLLQAAERFADSVEWQSTRELLPSTRGHALDLGAGRGISSYALARDGWQVTALEPDDTALVGTRAIRALADESGLPIRAVQEYAERLPFADGWFDLAHGRQVLHHAHDLGKLCQEACRVLKPGGWFIATREHVISTPEQLPTFLANHPLHKFYGGENAFMLKQYLSAIQQSGLVLRQVLGPYDNPINYFPVTHAEWHATCRHPLARLLGDAVARALTNEQHAFGRWLIRRLAAWRSRLSNSPGRMYTFLARKPA